MKRLLLPTIFILLFLTTCRPDPVCEEPTPVCEICETESACIADMYDWLYFKTGTWWIYEEATTGVLDTHIVYSHQLYTDSSFEYRVHSSLDEFYYGQYYEYNYYYIFPRVNSIHCLTAQECTCHKFRRVKTRPGDFVGDATLTIFPFIVGNYSYSQGGGTTEVESTTESTNIGNVELSNVAKVNIDNCTSEAIYDPQMNFFIAEHIGIVRKENVDSNWVWTLIDYNIIQ